MNELFDSSSLLRHSGFLRSLALALVDGDPHRADDLVQETWLRAAESGAPVRSPRGWLGSILRNALRMRARSGARRRRREEQVAIRGDAASEQSAADSVARLELQRRVVAAVRELVEPRRTTVLRRYYDGLTVAEIARLDGVSSRAIQKRLQHALDDLRRSLDGSCGDRSAWTAAVAALGGARNLVGPAAAWWGGRAAAALFLLGVFAAGGVLWAVQARPAAAQGRNVQRSAPLDPERASGHLTATASTDGVQDGQDLVVSLERGVELRGLVHDVETGAPVAGALLRLTDQTNSGQLEAALHTERDGTFRTAVRAGIPFRIAVRPAGYAPRTVHGVRFEVGAPLKIGVGGAGTLRGVVRTSDGRPVAGARVLVARPGPAWTREFSRFERTFWDGEIAPTPTVTGADGTFVWRGLGAGPYEVLANAEAGSGARESIDIDGGEASIELTTALSPVLRLRVVDEQGDPVANCRVRIRRLDVAGTFRGRTDARGRIVAALPARERFRVGLHPSKHVSAVHEIDARESVNERTLVVVAGRTLRGRVVSRLGAGIAGIPVRASGRWVKTGTDGDFSIPGLGGDPVAVVAGGGFGPYCEVRLEGVAPGDRAPVLVAEPMPIVRGIAPAGEPLRAQLVLPGGGTLERSVDLAADGAFAVAIPPEIARFELRIRGRAPVVVEDLDMAPGAVRDLGRLDPPAGATLAGIVRDDSGAPLPGAKVSYSMPGGRVSRVLGPAFTGPDGRFELSWVPAGPGRVFASGRFGRSAVLDVPHMAGRRDVLLTIPRTGRLVAYLPGLPSGVVPRAVLLSGRGAAPDTALVEGPPGAWSRDLLPGRYQLTAGGKNIAVLDVRAGETAEAAHRVH